jgi:hypothetical protein
MEDTHERLPAIGDIDYFDDRSDYCELPIVWTVRSRHWVGLTTFALTGSSDSLGLIEHMSYLTHFAWNCPRRLSFIFAFDRKAEVKYET